MRLSITVLLFLTFCYVLSAQFWTDVKLEEMEWSNNCDLHNTCIQPTLQLRLINLFNNETISKIMKVNFDKQQTSETHLISFWNEGIPDMIVSTITINGIDPDYDFSRLCDSTDTIFLFQFAEMDQTYESILPTFLTVAVCSLITCLVVIYIFITINLVLKLGFKDDSRIKRISILKAAIFSDGSLNAAENSCECVRSQVFPSSTESGSLNSAKSQIKFSPKHTVSANSSFCGSIG
ncbi:putative integral membrane protein [Acanthocheilonema viteae]